MRRVVAFVKQFFQNLGGAPAVVAVTVWRDSDAFNQEIHVQSGSALMQNLLLAAEAEGLGTCWMSGVLTREKELLKFLGLEDRHLLAITPIGYSAKTPPVVPRKDRPVRWLGFYTCQLSLSAKKGGQLENSLKVANRTWARLYILNFYLWLKAKLPRAFARS